MTGKTAGEVIITAKTAATANYKEGAETVKITVTEPQFISIEDAEISGLTDRTYNGNNQTQTPVVKLKDGTILTEGTDYTVSYANNKNAGTATVIITGKGNYEKTTSATFKITKAAQNFTVKAAAASIDVGKTTKVTVSGAKESPKYTFATSNAKVATVTAAGTVTGKAAGTVTITVKAAETANYKAGSRTGHHHCQQSSEEARQLPLYQVEQHQVYRLPDRLEQDGGRRRLSDTSVLDRRITCQLDHCQVHCPLPRLHSPSPAREPDEGQGFLYAERPAQIRSLVKC